MTKPGPSVTSGADTQPGSDSLFPSGFGGGGANVRPGGVGTSEIADGSVAAADLNLPSVAAAIAARSELTGTYARLVNRNVWAIGDSLTAGAATGGGGPTFDAAVYSSLGQGGIEYQPGSWTTHALLNSACKWTLRGMFATSGYTAAQILATHVPSVIAAASKGDTVVVLAGTNGNVLADTKTIHATLRAAGLNTVAVTIPPSTSSTLDNVYAFNEGLKAFCYANTIPLADVHAAVVDTANGAYLSAINGDGVHPNQNGFQIVGQTIASTLSGQFPGAISLVNHNGTLTNQLQSKPLALGTPVSGTDYSALSALGTSTIAAGAVSGFVGGNGYIFTVGDSTINGKMKNYTLTAGHTYRVGMALSATPAGSGSWGLRLESNTTGQKILWGMGYPTATTIVQGVTRFYSEFIVPAGLPDYVYRLRTFVSGTGSVFNLGEVTMADLTAMGLA